jgi:hypothetical protein
MGVVISQLNSMYAAMMNTDLVENAKSALRDTRWRLVYLFGPSAFAL